MIITIDGPVASGKSTIGKLLAKNLGAYYIYTGLLYRALAYLLMRDYGYTLFSIHNPNEKDIDTLLDPKRYAYRYSDSDGEQIWFDQKNITELLKNPTTDQAASIVSTNPYVRAELNKMQREIANQPMVVIDGRDAGSVVFPQADYKFFLTADPQERAYRWQMQQRQKGNTISFEQAIQFLQERDRRDSQRAIAPLIVPDGAQMINTTAMSIDEVVAKMMAIMGK
jgi:cytidylate kinase